METPLSHSLTMFSTWIAASPYEILKLWVTVTETSNSRSPIPVNDDHLNLDVFKIVSWDYDPSKDMEIDLPWLERECTRVPRCKQLRF